MYITPQRNNNLYEVVHVFFSNTFLRDIFKVFDVRLLQRAKALKNILYYFHSKFFKNQRKFCPIYELCVYSAPFLMMVAMTNEC